MRKRAQRRSPAEEAAQTARAIKPIKKKNIIKKNQWMAISLVGIFFMVLFLNSYFNIVSEVSMNPEGETVSEKFYLSGPDPYYNMRLVNQTLETGKYPFFVADEKDPLLNYPIGRSGGGRAPLMNMMAIGFSRLLVPFMSETDAIGYAMQFVPALFGALLVFPVYFIGKTLFGKKEGIVAAMLVAIIPIHLGSGHGSAYALFDHDSLNLLLFFITFLFLIKSVKEKDPKKSLLYALLSGIPLAGLSMVWVEAQFLYVVIALYAIIQILIDTFTSKIDRNVIRNLVVILFTGYLVSLPVQLVRTGGFRLDITLFVGIGIALFGVFSLVMKKMKIPWVISLPLIFCGGGAVATLLYFITPLTKAIPFFSPLTKLSEILYGSGIYGNKVSQTIAEASTYNISRSVMSYGPAIYWLAWFGLVFLMYRYFTEKGRRDYLFIIALFIIDIWLASTAGRFLNDMVPLVALLGGWATWFAISKIDYKQMFRNIRNAGGGLRGLRKGIKIYHVLGILFVVFLVMMSNTFLALDAAVPGATTKNGTSNMKIDYFGEDHSGAFGSSSYKEQYWVDAFAWLNDQDTGIVTPGDRPAFISWWDYGFYGVAIGGHPVVADNFQDGIPPAANFHTATSEKDAIGVWIVRLLQGDMSKNSGAISTKTKNALINHLGENNSNDIVDWMENTQNTPSYHAPIGAEYDEELSKELLVGEQYGDNAWYHDITELFNNALDDEGITLLYHDIQESTGLSIRYYGVEGYDEQIFNIFGFLADKSLVLHALRKGGRERFYNPEDDFIQVKYTGYHVNSDGTRGDDGTWTANELNGMSDNDLRYIAITDTTSENKPDYYKTMFYRTYIGNIPEALQNQVSQLPCWEMKHFAAEYISPYPYYGAGRSAVVIAKYYEGAKINGSVEFMGSPLQAQMAIRKSTSLYGNALLIDHDKTDAIDGNFSLIAPAGDITLEIRRYPEMGINAFVLKSITFNSTSDHELATITDDDAMRVKGSNFERSINITVDPATSEGYVYQNKDDDDAYNVSSDDPLSDVEITLWEINETDPETGQPVGYGAFNQMTTDDQGHYNVSGLMPGIYMIRAILDDFVIHENYAFIYSGNNSYNISKPKPVAVEGTIYFDENENDIYDNGEEMDNANVELLYTKTDGENKLVKTMTTDETGSYAFTSLNPGKYVINATKVNGATGYLDYANEEQVTLTENETTTFNVSIRYAPIVVSGLVTYEGTPIEEVGVFYDPDESVENNTAEENSKPSDSNGAYELLLLPGKYNVSLVKYDGETLVYIISGEKLELTMGQGTLSNKNFALYKVSSTVSGFTTDKGNKVNNISINFDPIDDSGVKVTALSDETGAYSVELTTGNYTVTVNQEMNVSGELFKYTFSRELEIPKDNADIPPYNIVMAKEEWQ
jgi:dolichyl-diphosphooligosaccharide--protein glycosyltransferase